MKRPASGAKRSKSISLLLMGALALGPAGCGSDRAEIDESFTTFTSLEQCVTSGLFTDAECRDFARSALLETPSFASQAECEARFGAGNCQAPDGDTLASAEAPADAAQQAANGTVQRHSGSMWMPMMMGFMAGRFMGAGGPMQGSQGLYRDSAAQPGSGGTQSFRTATGDTVTSDAKGRVTTPSPALKQSLSHNAKPVMTRGGSASKGGFSGGSRVTGAGS